MKNEIKIEIAGFCISIEMNDPVTARNVREYYEDFLTSKKDGLKETRTCSLRVVRARLRE